MTSTACKSHFISCKTLKANTRLFALGLLLSLGSQQAAAFECANAGAGAVAPNDNGLANNTACGNGANATGFDATAVGSSANANSDDATAVGTNAMAVSSDTTALGEDTVASGDDATAVGSEATATRDGATSLGFEADATGVDSVAVGRDALASGDNTVAIGGDANKNFTGASATGTDATAVGADSQAAHAGSVALGAGSTTNANDTVSIGGVGRERRITNVAPAVNGTDSVNLSQLNAISGSSNAQIGRLNTRIDDLEDDAFGGIASVAALATIPTPRDGRDFSIGVGYGHYEGSDAVAVGFSANVASNLNFRAGLGRSNSRSTYAAGAAFSW